MLHQPDSLKLTGTKIGKRSRYGRMFPEISHSKRARLRNYAHRYCGILRGQRSISNVRLTLKSENGIYA